MGINSPTSRDVNEQLLPYQAPEQKSLLETSDVKKIIEGLNKGEIASDGLDERDAGLLLAKYPQLAEQDIQHIHLVAQVLGEEFKNNYLLNQNAGTPPLDKVAALAAELKSLDEFHLDTKELEELRALVMDVNKETVQVTEYIEGQKLKDITLAEVYGDSPSAEQKKIIDAYKNLKIFPNSADFVVSLSESDTGLDPTAWAGASVLSAKILEQMGDQSANGKTLTKEDVNKFMTEGFSENSPLVKDLQMQYAHLENVYDYFANNGQADILVRSTAFTSAVDHKAWLEKVDKGEVNLSEILNGLNSGNEVEVKSAATEFQESVGWVEDEDYQSIILENVTAKNKELQTEIAGSVNEIIAEYTDAAPESKMGKAFAGVEDILTKAALLGEKMNDLIVNNFEQFDKLFKIPIFGDMLKDLLVGKEGDKPGGWYYEARKSYIEKQGELSPGEQVLRDMYLADNESRALSEGSSSLEREVASKKWYKNLNKMEEGDLTKESIKAFDTDKFAKTIVQVVPEKVVNEIPSTDPLDGSRTQLKDGNFLIRALARKVYGENVSESEKINGYIKNTQLEVNTPVNTEEGNITGSTRAEDERTLEQQVLDRLVGPSKRVPTEKLQRDVTTYIARRLDTVIGEHKAVITDPQQIAELLITDLIQQGNDYALEYNTSYFDKHENKAVQAAATTPKKEEKVVATTSEKEDKKEDKKEG